MNQYKYFGEIVESHPILVLNNQKIRATVGILITFPFYFLLLPKQF
jgi:hypothetical protein